MFSNTKLGLQRVPHPCDRGSRGGCHFLWILATVVVVFLACTATASDVDDLRAVVDDLHAVVNTLLTRVKKQDDTIALQNATIQRLHSDLDIHHFQNLNTRRELASLKVSLSTQRHQETVKRDHRRRDLSAPTCSAPLGAYLLVDGVCSCTGDVVIGNRSVGAELRVMNTTMYEMHASLSDALEDVARNVSRINTELIANTYTTGRLLDGETSCEGGYYLGSFRGASMCTPCNVGCTVCTDGNACGFCSNGFSFNLRNGDCYCPDGFTQGSINGTEYCVFGSGFFPSPAPG